MVKDEEKESPHQSKSTPKQPSGRSIEGTKDLFSPRFRSVAAMAGWDEEAILIASVVVEDTPEREIKHKKRSDPLFKTPNSRRKRRASRNPAPIPVLVLDVEQEDKAKIVEAEKVKMEKKVDSAKGGKEVEEQTASSSIPCIDRLREELSCAICLEICFEPTTTPCGHSFCKKCLRYSADKCGKRCPKCRQLISNGRSCTVNTVLWNTIQLLFPQEVDARMKARSGDNHEAELGRAKNVTTMRNVGNGTLGVSSRRRGTVSQDQDAALALRLQREEFMEAFRGSSTSEQGRSSSASLARENLIAMASRAMSLRSRGRYPTR